MAIFNNPYNYYNNYQQYGQQMQQPQQNQQSQQIQQNGFVSVRSEEEARNYPIALGTSVTFMDENKPFVYAKTMGFSQLDRPTFKVFKLVEQNQAQEASYNNDMDKSKGEEEKALYETLNSDIDHLKKEVKDIKKFMKQFEEE